MLTRSEYELLATSLRQLRATGLDGLEGLVRRLVSLATGTEFVLARSGTQGGRDMSSSRDGNARIAVECKRYSEDSDLDETEIKGKLATAATDIPDLDLWVLAATRTVSDQLHRGLEETAERLNVDVLVLALNGADGGNLATICALDPGVVAEALQRSGIASAGPVGELLDRARARPEFSSERDELAKGLNGGIGRASVARRLATALNSAFTSAPQSRAAFGQALDVEGQAARGLLVGRSAVALRLEEWFTSWSVHRTGIALVGDEGDGKTWALATWLASRIKPNGDGPIALWVPSKDATADELPDLIAQNLSRRLGQSSERWRDRVIKWAQSGHSNGPLLLLVLDGINERHHPQWWRRVIEQLAAEPWGSAIAPIVTTRPSYWPKVAGYSHINWLQVQVSGYDESELDTALSQRGLTRKDLPPEIYPLVRRPRYLELAVQHRTAMVASGDITVPRLIYEDWRDRESRRAGLASEAEFQQAIATLAGIQRERQRLEAADLQVATAGSEYGALLGELQTSGVLVPEGRHWRVEPARLALGLGLLLVERLSHDNEGRQPSEVLESWLEPAPDVDLKASIVEHALIHSLRSSTCPTEIRSLLIAKWLGMRNQEARLGTATASYFLLDPAAFLSAAEALWSDDIDDAWAEEVLKDALERVASSETVLAHLVPAFERWMGLVLDHDETRDRGATYRSRLAQLSEELGREVTSGPLQHGGATLTVVSDPGLLRLSRLALAIISTTDRRPFAHALATGYLADALDDRSNVAELCRWVIRTAGENLWPLLEPEGRRFAAAGSTAGRQAAYRLFTSVGTAAALDLRAAIPDDTFPTSALLTRYEQDPCIAGFAWRTEHCSRCAGRDDVPVRIMAQQLAKCVRDPTFAVPQNTVDRLVAAAETIDTQNVWSSVGQTEHDLSFDTVEAVTASCAPSALADVVRRLAVEVRSREELALRQLAYQLRRFRLALTPAEMSAIRLTWDRLRIDRVDEDKEATRAEHALFDLLLSRMSAGEQLDGLLKRPREAKLYTSFGNHFKPLAWGELRERLQRAQHEHETACILALACSHPKTVPNEAGDDLTPLLGSGDALVRYLAFMLIYRAGLESAGKALSATEWRAGVVDGRLPPEDHWGSLVLARWGRDLTYDELRERVAPTYLGEAVSARGFRPNEVTLYAEDLDEAWRHCSREPETPYPSIEVTGRQSQSADLELPRVPISEFSKTITFQARGSAWGGKPSEPPPGDLLSGPSDAELQSMHTRLGEVLAEQREARNHWFARRFSTKGLKEVILARPDLVDRWLGGPSGLAAVGARTWLARSFYESLCEVLLSTDPVKGSALYEALCETQGPVHFIDEDTEVPILDFVLFGAPDCNAVRVLWESHLERAASDRDLLVLAALAAHGPASPWLSERIEMDLASENPLFKVRALRLLGFGSDGVPKSLPTGPVDALEWQQEQLTAAVKDQNVGEWARRWFATFVSTGSDDVALGAFRMFLRCVDSRYVWWRDGLDDLAPHRRSFLASAADDIEGAIKKNEEKLRNQFLGMRVARRQVWPWL